LHRIFRASILIATSLVVVLVLVPFLGILLGPTEGNNPNWPSECGSSFEIVYSDPSKHNATKIREAIENKAPEMIDRFHGAHRNWWDYVSVDKPDENGTALMGVPGIFSRHDDNPNYDLLIESLMELEGISEIIPRRAWCT